MEVPLDLDKFTYCERDIIDRLYAESELSAPLGTEAFMALPKPDAYIKRQSKVCFAEEIVKEKKDEERKTEK
jgi:hypothetical protein